MNRPRFDCQACGACCCNTSRNRLEGTLEYVEVARSDRLYKEERALLRELGARNEEGVFHLRLVGEEQRCVALAGELGVGVGCQIYRLRPAGCRAVEIGRAHV
jgi:Fe-S-cluster containining protein